MQGGRHIQQQAMHAPLTPAPVEPSCGCVMQLQLIHVDSRSHSYRFCAVSLSVIGEVVVVNASQVSRVSFPYDALILPSWTAH